MEIDKFAENVNSNNIDKKQNKPIDTYFKKSNKSSSESHNNKEMNEEILESKVIVKNKENSKGVKKTKINKESKDSKESKESNDNNIKKDVPLSNSFSNQEIFISALDTWIPHLDKFLKSETMTNIFNFVKNEYSTNVCYPPADEIFNAFKFTKWEDVRVVIIGQDPYFNENEAMGLCFSVNRGIKVPKSLVNIYKALVGEKIIDKIPNHGDLSEWAKQGVLMLNATLTVKAKEANSHQKKSNWEKFTDYVIKTIDENKKNVVFILWGNFAIKKKDLLKSGNSHVITNIHPSPLAASKGDFGSVKQFSKANEILKENGCKEIDWKISA